MDPPSNPSKWSNRPSKPPTPQDPYYPPISYNLYRAEPEARRGAEQNFVIVFEKKLVNNEEQSLDGAQAPHDTSGRGSSLQLHAPPIRVAVAGATASTLLPLRYVDCLLGWQGAMWQPSCVHRPPRVPTQRGPSRIVYGNPPNTRQAGAHAHHQLRPSCGPPPPLASVQQRQAHLVT